MSDVGVEKIVRLKTRDLSTLTEAASAAILDGSGFGWLKPPPRDAFERYWRGVLLVPERTLFVARLDEAIVGSVQLVAPPPQKEAWAFAAGIDTHFVAPWARGHGLARPLMEAAEKEARRQRFKAINLSVSTTQDAAIHLYESLGYKRWGTLPHYALRDGNEMVAGHYFQKELK